jgi:hypothetical protein
VKRTTRFERASPGWRPGALPTELHPHMKHARLESNQRPLPSQSSALPLSYERKEPPAGVEPAPRPYKGRVLAVDTTEAGVEPEGFEPSSSRRSIGFSREQLPGTRAGAIAETHAAAP